MNKERSANPGAALDDDLLEERLRAAIDLLESIEADRSLLAAASAEDRTRLLRAARAVFEPDAAARRRLVKATRRRARAAIAEEDERLRANTGIRELRSRPVFTTPDYPPPRLQNVSAGDQQRTTRESRICYVCKAEFTELHHFYDQLCPPCADLNFFKRTETADLSGRVALLTGGRVKIGYQAALKLLRAGASVIITTRFPRDSAARFAGERDFADWSDRVEIFGLDLRHTPSVEAFCQHVLATRPRLDFIINNACQTVRRPAGFYDHLMRAERTALEAAAPQVRRLVSEYEDLRGSQPVAAGAMTRHETPFAGLLHAAELSQVELLPEDAVRSTEIFPHGQLDQDLQQIDRRDQNSWRLLLAEVPTVELLEVQLVNAIAPFIINARLKPLMMRTPGREKHIVNVSAMEGQFYRHKKTTRHPHTNMAKAALNMMTRTSAADYVQDGIHMNSVDTGWVTDEDPLEIATRKRHDLGFHPPLDIVDGAARIVDPIISGVNTGTHVWGRFLKDYRETDW